MKLFKLNSRHQVNVNISEYLIDWENGRQVSKPQSKVADFLRPYWQGHIVCSEFRIPGSLLRVDFINFTRKIAIEVSPSGTHSFNKFFHKNRPTFGAAINREIDKAKWLEQNGINLIEVFDDDIDNLSEEWFKTKYDCDL
jgi:hypothetical protein